MKHIRLFEGFSNDEYYTTIDSATYDELSDNTINMTNKDIEIITKDLKYAKDIHSKVLVIFPESGSMRINKLDDDWFIVRISSIRDVKSWPFCFQKYKCDQIEGLLTLLKDKGYLK